MVRGDNIRRMFLVLHTTLFVATGTLSMATSMAAGADDGHLIGWHMQGADEPSYLDVPVFILHRMSGVSSHYYMPLCQPFSMHPVEHDHECVNASAQLCITMHAWMLLLVQCHHRGLHATYALLQQDSLSVPVHVAICRCRRHLHRPASAIPPCMCPSWDELTLVSASRQVHATARYGFVCWLRSAVAVINQ